jgi:hypothetical protein
MTQAQLAQHNFGLNGDERLDDDHNPDDEDDDILDDGDEC